MKERLKAILAEKQANPELYQKEGYKYFDEFIPTIEQALKEVPKPEKQEAVKKEIPMKAKVAR